MKYLKFKIIVTLILSLSALSLPAQVDKKQQLLNLVNEEMQEVIRLNKQVSIRNPNLLLRLAELYLEKARILKEIENDKYLSLPPEVRSKSNIKDYFTESTKYYVRAQKACKIILTRFPNFKGKADVLYILAFNAKEFQFNDKAKKYFEMAISKSTSDSATSRKSKLAVAELYYNNQEFEKAAKYYEESLREIKGKWWTKDAFNLAWCYFRVGKKAKAIAVMLKILELSKSSNYYDMSRDAKRDLALFYVDSGQVQEAINFYKRMGEDVTQYLLKVSKHLMEQNKYAYASQTLKDALPLVKDQKQRAEINLMLLQIHDKYGTSNDHFSSFKQVVNSSQESPYDETSFEIAKFQGEKAAALLQKDAFGNDKDKDEKRRRQKGTLAANYFTELAKLNPANAQVYYLNAAETYFAIQNFEESASNYEKSIKLAKDKNDSKTTGLAQKGLMALLAQQNVPKAISDKYLIAAYKVKLSSDPKSEDAKKIYQRLFLEYLEKKNIDEAERIFNQYRDNFPDEKKTQEAMLAKLLDIFLLNKNFAKYNLYFKKIKTGEISVNKEIKQKVQNDLTAIDFEKAEKANSSGDKVLALKYYYSIYQAPDKLEESRKIAAYNIAILYAESGQIENMAKWGNIALELMDKDDLKKFEAQMFELARKLFNFGYPDLSADFNKKAYFKMCNGRYDKKEQIFKNAIILKVSLAQFQEAQELIESGKNCEISQQGLNFAQYELIDELISRDNLSWAKKLIDSLIDGKIVEPKFSILLERFSDALRAKKEPELAKNYIRSIPNFFGKNFDLKNVPVEVLDVYVRFQIADLDRLSKDLESSPLAYPEDHFRNQIKEKFKLLDTLSSKSASVLKMGSGKGVVRTFKILSDAYLNLAEEIRNFTPPNKDEAYVAEFKKSLQKIVDTLEDKGHKFDKDAETNILKNMILSPHNYEFLRKQALPLRVRYQSVNRPTIMDRGGK